MKTLIYKDEAYKIIGACMKVHRELGAGFLEKVYHEALCVMFTELMIPFENEKELTIIFRGKKLAQKYYADFVCFNKIIIEVKSISAINDIHRAQVFNYFKDTGYKLGLLVNFGENSLKYERIIKTKW